MPQHATPGSLLGKIAAYTELLAKDPYSTIFVPLSEAYRQMDMLDEAVEVARQGIIDNPTVVPGYVALGGAFAAQGLDDQAIGEFEKALILDHRHLPALKELAKMKLARQESDGARELLERAKAVKGNDTEVLKLLAAMTASRPVAAPAMARNSTPAAPATAGVFVVDEAREPVAETSVAGKMVEPIATATLAEIYIRQGLPQKALKVYRDLLKAEPHNDPLRQKLVLLKQQIDGQEVPALGDETLLASESLDGALPAEEVALRQEPLPSDESLAQTSTVEMSTVSPVVETEVALSVPTEDSATVEPPGPAAARIERAVPEVLTHWLDAIRRRRAVHV